MDETKETKKEERKEARKKRREEKRWIRKLCRSTTIFSLLRVPFTLAGFFLGALIPIGVGRLTSSATLTVIASFLGVFVYKQVTNWGKNQYQSAQVAIITVGLKRHRLPKNTFASGMKMVNFYFEASAITSVLSNILKYCYNKVFHRVSFKEAQHEAGSNIFEDIKAMIVVTICTLIPYLGYCIMSHMVYFAECTRVQAVCDAVEGFFLNLKKMVPRMLKCIIPSLIKLTINFLICVCFMVVIGRIFLPDATIEKMYSFVEINMGDIARNYEGNIYMYLVAICTVASGGFAMALNLFSQSSSIYSTLEKYYEAIETNPSKGYIYSKLKKLDKDAITLGNEDDTSNT